MKTAGTITAAHNQALIDWLRGPFSGALLGSDSAILGVWEALVQSVHLHLPQLQICQTRLDVPSSLHDPITKHFILADLEEQESTRAVVFAVFTSRYEFVGACHWTQVTQVWDILDLCGGDKGWVVYHNNRRLRHHKVPVHHGDVFACYERNDCNTPFQADRIGYDAAMDWVANAPAPVHSEAAGPAVSVPSAPEAADEDSHVDAATFERTGDPLLLIGRDSGLRSRGDNAEALHLSPFQ